MHGPVCATCMRPVCTTCTGRSVQIARVGLRKMHGPVCATCTGESAQYARAGLRQMRGPVCAKCPGRLVQNAQTGLQKFTRQACGDSRLYADKVRNCVMTYESCTGRSVHIHECCTGRLVLITFLRKKARTRGSSGSPVCGSVDLSRRVERHG